jgi:hypothetical protein
MNLEREVRLVSLELVSQWALVRCTEYVRCVDERLDSGIARKAGANR